MKTEIKSKGIYAILYLLALCFFVSCDINLKDEEVLNDKDDMIEAFAAVNEAIPRLNNLDKGTVITEYTGFFMPAGEVVKTEMNFKKTDKGVYNKIREADQEGESQEYDGISEESISDITYYQLYPKEKEPEEISDKVEKLTVAKDQNYTAYRIDWLPEETNSSYLLL